MPERKTLAEVEAEAVDLMARNDLLEQGWTFRWMQSKTVYGSANHTTKVISLSKPRAAHEGWEYTRDTILHEIAHAIAGPGANHGPDWRRIARELGTRPEASMNEPKGGLRTVAPWVGRCAAGHQAAYRYFRKPTARRSCNVCHPGRFSLDHLLTYTRGDAS